MTFFTYHLIQISFRERFLKFYNDFNIPDTKGIVHYENMYMMRLGEPIFSYKRYNLNQKAILIQWKSEADFQQFKSDNNKHFLFRNWCIELELVRIWGHVDGFDFSQILTCKIDLDELVVGITVARTKLFDLPRFIHWGIPVERFVKNHKGIQYATASIRGLNTISTFTIWENSIHMRNMVNGHHKDTNRHHKAMIERNRKDFYSQFTTLRMRPIKEHGKWYNQSFLNTDD